MQKNYNENLVAGAAIRDDKGRRISKLFEASHPKMTVGYAKNLIMPDTPTEQEFNLRQSGGGVIEDGVAVIDKVKGNSVVWNQMIKVNLTSCDDEGITSTLSSDGGVILNGVAANDGYAIVSFDVKQILPYHKVALYRDNLIGKSIVQIPSSHIAAFGVSASAAGDIFTCEVQDDSESLAWVKFNSGDSFTNDKIHIGIADLTQMFGAGNEPTTYEEFLQRKPKVADEYSYNEGTIVNNNVEKVVTTGRNLWDEEWEKGDFDDNGNPVPYDGTLRAKNFSPIVPNTQYCVTYGGYQQTRIVYLYWYDQSKTYIKNTMITSSSMIITPPSNAAFMKLRTGGDSPDSTYNHDICINISDPSINGKYFPYEKHELDLSWVKDIKDGEGVKLFEDGMKSAGTAFDEVRKDKAVKRLGSVDLGDLAFTTDGPGFSVIFPNAKTQTNNIICERYSHSIADNLQSQEDKSIRISSVGASYIVIKDSTYSDVNQLIASLSGVIANYELAEPIEVEYDEKNLTYPVVAGGTEEAIASEPSTAFRADIGYGIDAVKTILDLKARVEALEGK